MSAGQDVGRTIKLIHDAVKAKADSQFRVFDLTLSQVRVLHFLGRRHGEPASQKDIEDFFHVTHPTMIGILRRLEHKGFVQSTVNAQDRRLREIRLTAKGEQAQAVLRDHARHMDRSMLQGLSEQEVAELTRLLAAVYRNIAES